MSSAPGGLVVVRGVVAAALVASLAACQAADPETRPAPTDSATVVGATGTAAPEPVKESPEDFIRRWQAAVDEAQESGSAGTFRSMSTRRCETCLSLADEIEQIYAGGGSIEFGGTEIVNFIDSPVGAGSYRYLYRAGKTVIRNRASKVVETIRGGESVLVVEVVGRPGNWKVAFMGVAAQ